MAGSLFKGGLARYQATRDGDDVMRYLRIRTETKPRRDGSRLATPLVVDSPHRYAKRKQEKSLKRLSCQLILGAADAGKSRWLHRLHERWQDIWGAKMKAEPVFISALQPVSSWTDAAHVEAWYNRQQEAKRTAGETAGRGWTQLNQSQRGDLLAEYIHDTGALLFVDDAHRLTGRKLQVARSCVLSARVWLLSASQENRLAPSLRTVVERREPQRTQLQTEASYDATSVLMWSMIALAVAIGWWEAGLVLGGLKMLGSGRRAARAE